jgi:TRAP-type mannitol/chloroaromatic compound transport system permease small subunit
MPSLLKFSDRLARLCTVAARIGSWTIVPLILIIVFDVVMRKIPAAQQFVATSALNDYLAATRLQEMEWHFHAVIFLLAYGFAYLDGTHVRVDIWRDRRSERSRGFIELAGLMVFAIPYVTVLIWFGWEFVAKSYLQHEASPSATGLPNRWIVKSFLLIGAVLLMCSLAATLMRVIVYLFGSPEHARAARARLGMIPLDKSAERA